MRGITIRPSPKSVFFRCVEDCNDTVMITDAKGKILYTNPAWRELYGYSNKESVGLTPRLIHSGRQDKMFYRKMWKSITNAKRGYWRGELVNRSKDGTFHTVLLTISPFKSGQGVILGYMGIATDLTKTKALERKLKTHEQLGVLKYFSERLAHEIGTTLSVIRGRAEFLLTKYHEPEALQDGLRIITEQADRISKLLGYLLRFSRSAKSPGAEKIELLAKVEKALAPHRMRAGENFIDLELNISKDLAVLGDRKRLLDSLESLIENAIEAIEDPSKVGRTNDHKITFRAYKARSKVILEIRDTGCGISEENLTKVFQPFFTTKDIGKGTGMGLTMAARFIEDMGGEVSVESEERGTVFKIALPEAA
jgi:two-component system cell cycle sensor histidine kinase/response regulator CckA